jgi:hypothetical protein
MNTIFSELEFTGLPFDHFKKTFTCTILDLLSFCLLFESHTVVWLLKQALIFFQRKARLVNLLFEFGLITPHPHGNPMFLFAILPFQH